MKDAAGTSSPAQTSTGLFRFAQVGPHDLAIFRMLLFGSALYIYRRVDPSGWLTYREAVWLPRSFYEWLNFDLLSQPYMDIATWLWRASLAACTLGLGYRWMAPVAATLTLYILGMSINFGKVDHSANLLTLGMGVMCFARASDVWSIDTWMRSRTVAPVQSEEYRWPLFTMWLLVLTMYMAAGIAKLQKSGFDWALGDNFKLLLIRHHYTHLPPTDIGLWISHHPTLCRLLALGALCTELIAPLALFHRWARWVIASALAMLQFSIWMLMGVKFLPMLPMFLSFVPWSRLGVLLRRSFPAG